MVSVTVSHFFMPVRNVGRISFRFQTLMVSVTVSHFFMPVRNVGRISFRFQTPPASRERGLKRDVRDDAK